MKQITKNSLFKRFAIVLILFSIAISINSCRKELYVNLEVGQSNLNNKTAIENLKLQFKNSNIEEQLEFTYQDSIHIKWQPNWKKLSEHVSGDSINYLYIPLKGEIFTSKDSNRRRIKTFNTQKYVIAYLTKKGISFFSGTYTNKGENYGKTTNIQSSKDKARVSVQNNHSINFKQFSGNLELKDLKSKNTLHFDYSNSKQTIKRSQISKASTNGVTAQYQMCSYYLNCVWYNYYPTYCGEDVPYAEVGHYVNSVNSIDECYQPPNLWLSDHNNNSCIPTWVFQGSYITAQDCYDVPDTNAPPLPDEGGGGGGDNGEVPTTTPPTEPSGTDPCQEKERIEAIQHNGTIQFLNNAILSHKNDPDGNEWSVKQNVTSLDGLTYNFFEPEQGGRDVSDYTFNWDEHDGYTIGSTHLHPEDNAPSPDDVFRMLYDFNSNAGIINNTLSPNGNESSANFYFKNVSTTIVTKSATYVVTIRNWDELQKIYSQNRGALRDQYNDLADGYKTFHPGASNGEQTSFALLALMNKAIHLFKAPAGTTNFKPIKAGIVDGQPILEDRNCP